MKKETPLLWPFVLVSITFVILYWVVAAFVLIEDPYNIYSWSRPSRLQGEDITDDNRLLVAAVAKNPDIDLLMVGSSTAMSYFPDDIKRAFPESRNPYNLSYAGAQPFDRNLTLNTVLRYGKPKRVIIWFDYTYALPSKAEREEFPAYLYGTTPINDLRMVNQGAVRAAYYKARGQYIFPHYAVDLEKRERARASQYKAFQSKAGVASVRAAVSRYRGSVLRPGVKSCHQLPALTDQLLPQLAEFSKRGWKVDVVIPAYSPAFYYMSGAMGSSFALNNQLMLRRCLIRGAGNMQNVQIVELDDDSVLVNNFGNFRDPYHIFGRSALDRALSDLNAGAQRLTSGNVNSYLASLSKRVVDYSPP